MYQSFHGRTGPADDAFLFYMAIYEELWRLDPGTLIGATHAAAFASRHPDHRADAHMVAQDLFRIGPNVYTQFLYFLSVMSRYFRLPEDGEGASNSDPLGCETGQPSPEDLADALTPTPAEKEAIARALAEGWISEEAAGRMTDEDALARRIATLPGHSDGDGTAIPEVMAAYYRSLAERHLVKPPARIVLGEAIVPTTLEEWDIGDPMAEIDWLATLRLRGEQIGGIAPLRRERIAEYEGADVPLWQTKVEIYLDVSGSMPDPRRSLNAMTLAALVLAVGAIRAGGAARALVYSTGEVRYWTWCRSELEISRFLMHYIGGGTLFPFGVLAESVAECRATSPVRVVITDTDFDHNYAADAQNASIFSAAVRASGPMVLMLHQPDDAAVTTYRSAGAHVVSVRELQDFPAMAAALTRALFREGRS